MTLSVDDYSENNCQRIRDLNPKFEQEFAARGRCWVPSISRLNTSAVEAALCRHFGVDELEAREVPPNWEFVFLDRSNPSNDGSQVTDVARDRSIWRQARGE